MKIGFIAAMYGLPWGGSEELWYKAAKFALEEKHEVFIAVYDYGKLLEPLIKIQQEGAIVHARSYNKEVRSERFYKRWFNKVKSKLHKPFVPVPLLQPLIDFKPDVICVSQGGTYDIMYRMEILEYLSLQPTPYFLISQFNTETGVHRFNIDKCRLIFNDAQTVFFVSERNRRNAKRQIMSTLHNSIVISNPLNLENLTVVEWPNTDVINFACLARLDCNFKGQDILFEVLGRPEWQTRNWVLNLYGEGEDENYLKELAVFFQIDKRVRFNGQVRDIRKVWAENHIQLMPSISEGTPLALMEAMICGRPAVVTDVGGNADYVKEGETGFLAEAPSPDYFGSAMERAWIEKDSWILMGNNARKLSLKHTNLNPEKTLLSYLTKK